MAKCHNCNIEVLDVSEYCPLCRNVLEADAELENMYPDGRFAMRKNQLLTRIYLFCIIMIEAALIFLNVLCGTEVLWSAIAGLGLFYSFLVLRYAIIGKSGYRSKVFVLILMAVLSAIAVDFVTGYRGWAVDFLLPGGIIAFDLVMMMCIFIDRRGWQSYIMWLITMLFISIIPVALFLNGLAGHWYVAVSPAAVTGALLLGVFIIGGGRSMDELKRRFHVD